jgi:hypothetical protein
MTIRTGKTNIGVMLMLFIVAPGIKRPTSGI